MSDQMKTLISVVIVAIIAIGGYLILKGPHNADPIAAAPKASAVVP
jgi:hypothetical protein